MLKLVALSTASLLMLIGIIALISPIPLGLAIIAISLSLFICHSQIAKRLLMHFRSRHPRLHKSLLPLEVRLSNHFKPLHQALLETHP